MIRRPHVLAALLCLAVSAAADEMTPPKTPLTKEQERETFHPHREGMPPGPRLAGYARRLQMEKDSMLEGLRFRPVGPEVQGGRIVDIEAPLAHPDAFVVAFASGGLWRTENRGGSWTPLFDRESSITIGDVALGDPAGQTIYVGTGENNSSRTSYAGTGLFKTTDGGRTWRHLGLADSHHIGRVVVDARDPRTVYVAAIGHLYTNNNERGVYKSTDGGETWNRILYVDDRTGAIDLVQDPSRPEVLYAAMWERARTARNFLESGPGSGIWKSTDAGAHWTRLGGGLPAGATIGRIGLALPASRPQTLYAVIDNQTLRAESEPLDEETPPGELTPRRLRALTADAFARLDDAVVTRFLKRYDFPKSLKAAALKSDVKAGKITVAELIAYLSDANRDLFERQIVGPEVYRSDDGGATWARTHKDRLDKIYYSFGYYFGRISVDPVRSRADLLRRSAPARLHRRRQDVDGPRPARRARRPPRRVRGPARAGAARPRQRRRPQPLLRPRPDLDEGQQPARRAVHDPRPRRREAVQHRGRTAGQRRDARPVHLHARARAIRPPGARSTAATAPRWPSTPKTRPSSTPGTSSASPRASTSRRASARASARAPS